MAGQIVSHKHKHEVYLTTTREDWMKNIAVHENNQKTRNELNKTRKEKGRRRKQKGEDSNVQKNY